MLRLDQAARHWETHFAEADEFDFHGGCFLYFLLLPVKRSIYLFFAVRWIPSLRSQ